MILEAAVDFFAEHGFEAQTRDLAARLGISQGLIFRYFKTKQVLVEQVYQKVFVQRWSKEWEAGLKDRDVPLQERLERFYLSYFQAVDESHWIRVSLYAGLSGSDIITQYIETHVNRLLKVIQREMRVHRGLSDRVTTDPLEFELVWHLHSTFIYVLVRKYIHHQPVMEDKATLVARVVSTVLNGLPQETATPSAPASVPAPAKGKPVAAKAVSATPAAALPPPAAAPAKPAPAKGKAKAMATPAKAAPAAPQATSGRGKRR